MVSTELSSLLDAAASTPASKQTNGPPSGSTADLPTNRTTASIVTGVAGSPSPFSDGLLDDDIKMGSEAPKRVKPLSFDRENVHQFGDMQFHRRGHGKSKAQKIANEAKKQQRKMLSSSHNSDSSNGDSNSIDDDHHGVADTRHGQAGRQIAQVIHRLQELQGTWFLNNVTLLNREAELAVESDRSRARLLDGLIVKVVLAGLILAAGVLLLSGLIASFFLWLHRIPGI